VSYILFLVSEIGCTTAYFSELWGIFSEPKFNNFFLRGTPDGQFVAQLYNCICAIGWTIYQLLCNHVY